MLRPALNPHKDDSLKHTCTTRSRHRTLMAADSVRGVPGGIVDHDSITSGLLQNQSFTAVGWNQK